MRVHFSEPAFDYQTLRTMGYTSFGGAEPGEVLTTVERIDGGDTESWHAEWRRTADLVARTALEATRSGHERTARFAYLRAHNYYRTAEFFLTADDSRRLPTYDRSRETFQAGIARLDSAPETVDIPFENGTLPGYLFDRSEAREPRPTVVCLGGFDSLAEELYFLCGVPEAIERGYAVLLFDGPGQGAPLRRRGMTARPDWENVVGPVLDFLLDREGVDPGRIAVLGASFGGYYAPRAAAFDERIAACIAFDHMHDLWRASAYENPWLADVVRHAPDAVVNGFARLAGRFSLEARWVMENARWVFGVDSAAALQRTLRRYSLVDIMDRIDCPTLVLAGESDHFVPLGLAREFVDGVSGPTTLRVFRTEEGAGQHCQVGNLRLASGVIYDWLDETLLGRTTDGG